MTPLLPERFSILIKVVSRLSGFCTEDRQTDSGGRCQKGFWALNLVLFKLLNLQFVNFCRGGGGLPKDFPYFLYTFPNLDLAKHFSLSTKRFTMQMIIKTDQVLSTCGRSQSISRFSLPGTTKNMTDLGSVNPVAAGWQQQVMIRSRVKNFISLT